MSGHLLEGRTAVVTGAAGGIGLAVARLFHEHGAAVVLADLNVACAQAAAEVMGERAIGIGCDVTDESSVQNLVDDTVRSAGGLDVFVNNAGVTRDASLRKMTVSDFDTVISVHLRGTWLGLRAASAVGHGLVQRAFGEAQAQRGDVEAFHVERLHEGGEGALAHQEVLFGDAAVGEGQVTVFGAA
ncbi:SDR family oxidoreductase [Nocardia nova]|nr:SDR family oxidoreductase [Nocardia nova]